MPLSGVSFLAHQGRQAQRVLQEFLETAMNQVPGWRIGASVGLPRYSASTAGAIVEEVRRTSAYVLADPETHRIEMPFAERGRGRRDLDYLQESNPLANPERFTEGVLRAQIHAGSSNLISPWLIHGTGPSDRALQGTLRFARTALASEVAADRTLLVGVAITEAVLGDDDLRNHLIDELVDLPEAPFYFRVRISPPASYAQYGNELVLSGLRNLVRALQRNNRPILLPQTGLFGWLVIPDGALAFGSGIDSSWQRFIAPASGFGQPLEWYFCAPLLGFVLRSEVPLLASVDGFESCVCPYCATLSLDRPGPWDREVAGKHYLWWCSHLANELGQLPATSRREALSSRLEGALGFWRAVQASSIILDRRSEARHLEVWSQVTEGEDAP